MKFYKIRRRVRILFLYIFNTTVNILIKYDIVFRGNNYDQYNFIFDLE